MNRVVLQSDPYGLAPPNTQRVAVSQIRAARRQIRAVLLAETVAEPLLLGVKPEYRSRFADYIGFDGVVWEELLPRTEFNRRYHQPAPLWLNQSQIIDLKLLHSSHLTAPTDPAQDENAEAETILAMLEADLVAATTWPKWCEALLRLEQRLQIAVAIEPIQQALQRQMQRFMTANTAERLLRRWAEVPAPTQLLTHLAQQIGLEQLRTFTEQYTIDYLLPGRSEEPTFLADLPPLLLEEGEAGGLLTAWLSVLDKSVEAVEAQRIEPATLAELVAYPWPSLLERIRQLLDETIIHYATTPLAQALERLESMAAQELAHEVRSRLVAYPPLEAAADTQTARDWAEGYLEYARQRLERDREPDEAVGRSFSHWVVEQQTRISRSEMDWRSCSKRILHHLKDPTTRVFVCMVDALSAIQSDAVCQQLKKDALHEGLELKQQLLIAPYPTLTEIGKNAVLSGLESHQLKGTMVEWLWQIYGSQLNHPSDLLVLKSWEMRHQTIPEGVRLVVYLENRIDDRLHGATRYSQFTEELGVVMQQLARELKSWMRKSEIAGKRPVVLITADHGQTFIRAVEPLKPLIQESHHRSSERSISLYDRVNQPPEGFNLVESGGHYYLLPLRRVRLTEGTPLVHGGLTPEELLIPFIEISPPESAGKQPPLRVIQSRVVPIGRRRWSLQLTLQLQERLEQLRLRARPPFTGEVGPLGSLSAVGESNIILPLAAEVDQIGRVLLEIELSATRQNRQPFQSIERVAVQFLAPKLEYTDQSQSFEGMF